MEFQDNGDANANGHENKVSEEQGNEVLGMMRRKLIEDLRGSFLRRCWNATMYINRRMTAAAKEQME